jgi:hypothetical protein
MNNDLMAITDDMPKLISPRAHAMLDYGVAATFLAVGASFARHHKPAAQLALANGVLVLGMSMLTDYPGGIWKQISFRTHGVLDIMQAALAGFGPALMGFADDPEASYFYAQAASEVGVIAATDWNAA